MSCFIAMLSVVILCVIAPNMQLHNHLCILQFFLKLCNGNSLHFLNLPLPASSLICTVWSQVLTVLTQFCEVIMDHLHWRGLCVIMPQYRNAILPSLLALAIRIISISVTTPKVAKARTMVTVMCHCHQHYRAKLRQCKQGLSFFIFNSHDCS